MEITQFTYRCSQMRNGYTYTARAAEGGTQLEISLNYGDFTETLMVQEPVLEQLGAIAGKYRLDRWDGFDKVNKKALDGEMFLLSITLKDGSQIYAKGSNAFPKNYQDVKREINDLFKDLISSYSSLYPKTLASDELNVMMLSFIGEDGYKNRRFKFIANKQEDGRVKLDIDIAGYEVLLPEETYHFVGTCESFPFEDFQAIVRQYNLPAWNGWDRAAENYSEKESFQLEFAYTSDERISASGTLYPEGYDEARSALLTLCVDFIHENQGTFVSWDAE